MRRTALFVLVALVACGGDARDGGSGSGSGGGGGNLSATEAADAFLVMLAEWPGATLQEDAECPMENPSGDEFFHVLEQGFPSHVFSASPLEFPLTSSFGPGPDAIGGVVACVDGASGFLTIDQPTVEGMPMMDDPILLSVRGESGSDADLVGQSLAVALGVENDDGEVGLYATALAQICEADGGGCEQVCADPVAPASAQAEIGATICAADLAVGEDGTFAALGRTDADVLQLVDDVPVASCVRVAFDGAPMAHTVRVVASWSRADACGLDACADDECGSAHGFGVFTSNDGVTFAYRGIARGSETTALAPADPTAPDLPFVGEHFLVDDTIDSVLVCRLGYSDAGDQVAVDHVELCPG